MGKPHTRHLSERRIGLFGGNGHNPGTYPPLLGAGLKGRGLRLGAYLLSPETNQLINCRHPLKTPLKRRQQPAYINIKPLPYKTGQELNFIEKKKKCQAVLRNFRGIFKFTTDHKDRNTDKIKEGGPVSIRLLACPQGWSFAKGKTPEELAEQVLRPPYGRA
jgi:hypothetical protein